MVKVAGHQPVYLASLSLFALMKRVDVFVHCSHLQFVRQSWHHRNFIREISGNRTMLSIPVSHAGKVRTIFDATYEGNHWKKKHLQSLYYAYRGSPFFDQYYPTIKSILESGSSPFLSSLNIALTDQIAAWLGLNTPTMELGLHAPSEIIDGDAIDKLIGICKYVHADAYLSKPGAADYIGPEEEERLAKAGIKHSFLEWNDPDPMPFSAVHHLLTLGSDAQRLI